MKPIEFHYAEFNEQAWKYNVNKVFFLLTLGLIYSFIMCINVKFKMNGYEFSARLITGWCNVLFVVALFEATCATITKIGLTPGCLLDTKFTVFKVFYKSIVETYMSYINSFKTVTTKKTTYVYPAGSYGTLCLSGNGLVGEIGYSLSIPGYLKEPDTFK